MSRSERVIVDNKSLFELFDKTFIEKITSLGKTIFPVNSVFIYEHDEGGKKIPVPIIINHNSKLELENKTLHIECSDQNVLASIVKIIEGK